LDAFEGILNALIQYEKTKKNHGPRDDSGIMKMQNFNLKSLWSLWRSSYLDSMLKDDKEAVIGCIRKLTAATEFQLEYLLERHKKDFEERISNHLDWLELRGYKV
jgi:hypothetical protein